METAAAELWPIRPILDYQERDARDRVENGASPQQRLKQPKSNATPSEPTTEWTNTLAQQTFSLHTQHPLLHDHPRQANFTSTIDLWHRHDQERDDRELDDRERDNKWGKSTAALGGNPSQTPHPVRRPLSGLTPWHSRRSHHHVQYPLLQDHPRQANVTNTTEILSPT